MYFEGLYVFFDFGFTMLKEKKEWYIYEEKNRGKIKTVTP